MSERLAATITLYGLFLGAWALLTLLVGVRVGQTLTAGAILLELALIVQALIVGVAWFGDDAPRDPAVFVGYLAASVVVLPAAGRFGSERTAWDVAIVGIACIAVAVMSQRMAATW